MLSKLGILIKQLYKQKVRAKSFMLMTLLYVAIIGVIMFWSDIKGIFVNEEALEVALINETPVELESIFLTNEDIAFSFPTNSKESVYNQLKEEKYDAVVVVTEENETLTADIATYSPLKLNDQSTISSFVQYAGKIYGIQQLNLTASEADKILNSEAIITTTNLNEAVADGKSEDQKQSGIWASYFVGIVIYFFIMAFLSMITTDVASEKGHELLKCF